MYHFKKTHTKGTPQRKRKGFLVPLVPFFFLKVHTWMYLYCLRYLLSQIPLLRFWEQRALFAHYGLCFPNFPMCLCFGSSPVSCPDPFLVSFPNVCTCSMFSLYLVFLISACRVFCCKFLSHISDFRVSFSTLICYYLSKSTGKPTVSKSYLI